MFPEYVEISCQIFQSYDITQKFETYCLAQSVVSQFGIVIQSTLDTSNFKGLGKICRVISSSR